MRLLAKSNRSLRLQQRAALASALSRTTAFTVLRPDGIFACQLAVVVDDAFQGVTSVVRGDDLLDATPRQIHLQQLLGLPTPTYTTLPSSETNRAKSSANKPSHRRSTSPASPHCSKPRAPGSVHTPGKDRYPQRLLRNDPFRPARDSNFRRAMRYSVARKPIFAS